MKLKIGYIALAIILMVFVSGTSKRLAGTPTNIGNISKNNTHIYRINDGNIFIYVAISDNGVAISTVQK